MNEGAAIEDAGQASLMGYFAAAVKTKEVNAPVLQQRNAKRLISEEHTGRQLSPWSP